jgi:hypothetical protein
VPGTRGSEPPQQRIQISQACGRRAGSLQTNRWGHLAPEILSSSSHPLTRRNCA